MTAVASENEISHNRLLALLAPTSRDRLQALGRPISMQLGQLLIPQEAPITHVYFPTSGIVSLVVLMQSGRGVDAATVGREGLVGASLVLGSELMPWEATVQVAGAAWEIPASVFRQALNDDDILRDLSLRFIEALLVQAARSAACNQLHDVTQRLARYLLQVHDSVEKHHFQITQDFLAALLGVRRATVTTAAATLQQAGLITYRRGAITIADRSGLEGAACEDYVAIREAFARLLAHRSMHPVAGR